MKSALIIAVVTVGIICGAITGIVGGAISISGAAMVIHWFADDAPGVM